MEKFKERTGIYHEHQQSALCGVHALNNLLQDSIFSADSLAAIAHELDIQERNVLLQTESQSENVDDTGFFSIQVLQKALKAHNIELVSYASQEEVARQARILPHNVQAYICNVGLHWYTIRRFHKTYFNLNSMFYVPKIISYDLLIEYLKLIQDNDCSVFIVHGHLPVCIADDQLRINPISLEEYLLLTNDLQKIIIDNTIIDLKDTKLTVPRHIYEAYKKNPNDPEIKKQLLNYVPKHITDQLISKDSKINYDRAKRFMFDDLKNEKNNDQPFFGACSCRNCCRRLRSSVTDPAANYMYSDDIMNEVNETTLITSYGARYMVVQSESPRMIIASRMTVRSQSLPVNNPSADTRTFKENIQPDIGNGHRHEGLLQYVLSEPLNDSVKTSTSKQHMLYEAKLLQEVVEEEEEEWYRQNLEAAITASLALSNSIKEETQTTTTSKETKNAAVSSKPLMNEERTPSTTNLAQTSVNDVEKIPIANVEKPLATDPLPMTSTNSEQTSSTNSTLSQAIKSEQVPIVHEAQIPSATDPENTQTLNSSSSSSLTLSTKSISNSAQTLKTGLESTPTINMERQSMENIGRVITMNSEPIKLDHLSTLVASHSTSSANVSASPTMVTNTDAIALSNVEGKLVQ